MISKKTICQLTLDTALLAGLATLNWLSNAYELDLYLLAGGLISIHSKWSKRKG
jgi:hypothetical protein